MDDQQVVEFYECISREDWHSIFATKLIEDNFLLTALEFHAELIEAGKELPRLKDFFSNPGNFEQQSFNRPDSVLPRSSSQATLDSLDLARFSEDGERVYDEKVAVLEFELRKAKETITALRTNLTCAAEADADQKISSSNNPDITLGNIKPHEQRALNFLINEYLLICGYKLTSITFADQNESQDFEDWDDVGLNISRPRELLFLYREALRGVKINDSAKIDFECQTSFNEETVESNNNVIQDLELKIENLKTEVTAIQLEKEKLAQALLDLQNQSVSNIEPHSQESGSPEQDFFEMIDDIKSRGSSETKSIQSNGEWTKINDITKGQFESKLDNLSIDAKEESNIEDADDILTSFSESLDETDRTKQCSIKMEQEANIVAIEANLAEIEIPRIIPDGYKKEIFKCCDLTYPESHDVLRELVKNGDISNVDVESLVEILSINLQKIIPNIILNKREDIIPLLVLTICLCQVESKRDKLLSLLFNLKKRPQEDERREILKALVTIAKTKGQSITESELLLQCWEQIGHKYLERRLLVAEACLLLTPFVSEAMRNSLVLSMILQLTQDREEIIRCCSVRCLTVLVTLISVPDKLSQLCDISISLLCDSSPSVSQLVNKILLPALGQWSSVLQGLQTVFLDKLLTQIARSPTAPVLIAFESLLPYLVMFIAGSETVQKRMGETHPLAAKRQEFAALCKGLCDPLVFYTGAVGKIVSAFDNITSNLEDSSDWPELDWVMTELLPRLLTIAHNNWDQKHVLCLLVSLTRHLCAGLGKNITYNLIKPELSRRLETCSSALIAGQVENLEMIPLYLAGVLSLGPRDGAGLEQVGGTLLEFLCGLPLCGAPLLPLQVSVECLCRMDSLRVVVLDTLWEGVVHQRPPVRCATATLFQSAVPHIPDNLLAARVAPALVTLSNDPELSVKLAIIPTFGLLADTKEKATRDKITMTFQALLIEATTNLSATLAVQLVNTLSQHYERFETPYRNEVILPQLALMTSMCEMNRSGDLIKSLTETYSTILFSSDQIPSHILGNTVIPSLKSLESSCRHLELPYGERVESLLRHAERLVPVTSETTSRPMIPEPTALSPGARVEDVKNRVTKMFNTRPQSLQNVSGIFKKKL